MERKDLTFADTMKLMGIDEIADFKPTALVSTKLDLMVYIEKDVSYTSRHVPGSNISILYSNAFPEEIVGVEIWGFSKVFVPPEPLSHDAN